MLKDISLELIISLFGCFFYLYAKIAAYLFFSKDSILKSKNLANIFYQWEDDTLVLNILGTPSAKRDAIGKVKGNQLKVSVTAAPVAGKATDHMVKFLAKEFGVSASDIVVVYGRMNVNKQLRIKNPKTVPEVIIKNG